MYPAYKMFRDKDRGKMEGIANQQLAQIETHPMGKKQSLTLLILIYYAYKQEPSLTVL